MTTTTTTNCAGSATCKRPAIHVIDESYGRLYIAQARSYSREVFCKAHAAKKLAAMRDEMPDAERERRSCQRQARYNARYKVETISVAYKDALSAAVALGEGRTSRNTCTPDPEYAALLAAALAPLAEPIAAFREAMAALRP